MFWFFGSRACGTLFPQAQMESIPPVLECKDRDSHVENVLNIGICNEMQA